MQIRKANKRDSQSTPQVRVMSIREKQLSKQTGGVMPAKPGAKSSKIDLVIYKLDAVSREVKGQGRELRQHGVMLNKHGKILQKHGKILQKHGEILKKHGEILKKHGEKLQEHGKVLKQHEQKIDNLEKKLVHKFEESSNRMFEFWKMRERRMDKMEEENKQFRDQMLILMDRVTKNYLLFDQEKHMLGAGLDRVQQEIDVVKVSNQNQDTKISHLEIRVERLETSLSPN